MNEHRENVVPAFLGQQVLLGSHDSLEHRIDRLEVRWVGCEVHGRVGAVGRQERPGGAEVVLHVAGALDRVVAVIALEFAEDLRVGLAGDVRQNVQTTAMGHTDCDFEDVIVRSVGEDFIEQWDEGLRAFE